MCELCEGDTPKLATWACPTCEERYFCDECDADEHTSKKTRDHTRVPLSPLADTAADSTDAASPAITAPPSTSARCRAEAGVSALARDTIAVIAGLGFGESSRTNIDDVGVDRTRVVQIWSTGCSNASQTSEFQLQSVIHIWRTLPSSAALAGASAA
jgi:hypothetical protein